MRILFIRHGDPDYENDTLTEKGRREAQLLSVRMEKENVKDYYVSPLGRARDTASYTLNKIGRGAEVLEWLREFPAKLDVNHSEALKGAFTDLERDEHGFQGRIVWDMLPAYWKVRPEYSDRDQWRMSEAADFSDVVQVQEEIGKGLDQLLAKYGYVRDGYLYRTERGTNDTICCFCHFGVTCAMLAHLWGVSPFVLWHSLAIAPSSVTEVYTEEREKGIVSFRATKIGDISHLYVGEEPPSFSCRFCERYENWQERH